MKFTNAAEARKYLFKLAIQEGYLGDEDAENWINERYEEMAESSRAHYSPEGDKYVAVANKLAAREADAQQPKQTKTTGEKVTMDNVFATQEAQDPMKELAVKGSLPAPDVEVVNDIANYLLSTGEARARRTSNTKITKLLTKHDAPSKLFKGIKVVPMMDAEKLEAYSKQLAADADISPEKAAAAGGKKNAERFKAAADAIKAKTPVDVYMDDTKRKHIGITVDTLDKNMAGVTRHLQLGNELFSFLLVDVNARIPNDKDGAICGVEVKKVKSVQKSVGKKASQGSTMVNVPVLSWQGKTEIIKGAKADQMQAVYVPQAGETRDGMLPTNLTFEVYSYDKATGNIRTKTNKETGVVTKVTRTVRVKGQTPNYPVFELDKTFAGSNFKGVEKKGIISSRTTSEIHEKMAKMVAEIGTNSTIFNQATDLRDIVAKHQSAQEKAIHEML